jgi:gamma-glutamyltranspeptidase/glutathione hydrolase
MTGAIVAAQPQAVEEGAKVLMAGGNAIDAAVTCAMVQTVVDPQMCGIGGYALLTLHLSDQDSPIGIDAPALAGSKTGPDMWADKLLRPNPEGWGYFLQDGVNDAGYTSICTPGTVKALANMLQKWGTISWSDALEPAARIAEEGFPVTDQLARSWRLKAPYPEAFSLLDYIRLNPEASRIYLRADGSAYDMGEKLRNPDYAWTLRSLAKNGPEDFYRGDLALRMCKDFETNGAYVTASDLATYRCRQVAPVTCSYRGHTIASSMPPHGGPTLVAMLKILEGYEIAGMLHNSPDYIYLVSIAMKAAFADRNASMADPEFEHVPLQWMTSEERASQWRSHIDAGKGIMVNASPCESPHTTHVSVIDQTGNCVALTHSLGASSGVITPGLGFMYNNSMINFHPLPGHPNSIAPGKSRTTGMAPTIIYKNDQPVMVLGGLGATRIITSCLQVILNVIDFGMSVSDAISAPRFHCQSDMIRCQARIPEYVCSDVRNRHPIERLPQGQGGFASVHALTIDRHSGAMVGAADPATDGMALVV